MLSSLGLERAGLLLASGPSITVHVGNSAKPSSSILIILAVTLLAVAPSLLVLLTGFTKIVVVLGLTRNALGLQNIPPNQVVVGLALFLSLFLAAPMISTVDKVAVAPWQHGRINATQAYRAAEVPIRTSLARQTGAAELTMLESATKGKPVAAAKAPLDVLIPAYLLSQLRSAFLIGFIVFIPFLVIDLLVSATLMSMGMMMLPPTLVSLPFKVLLFVLVDGWTLVVHALLASGR